MDAHSTHRIRLRSRYTSSCLQIFTFSSVIYTCMQQMAQPPCQTGVCSAEHQQLQCSYRCTCSTLKVHAHQCARVCVLWNSSQITSLRIYSIQKPEDCWNSNGPWVSKSCRSDWTSCLTYLEYNGTRLLHVGYIGVDKFAHKNHGQQRRPLEILLVPQALAMVTKQR